MENRKAFFKRNVANWLTMLNISFGIASILFAFQGRTTDAIILVVLAAVADRYDGRIARHFNASSELGEQLDSLCDAVSFGVAPAILAYSVFAPRTSGHRLSATLLTLLVIIYICSGVFRLARFNVDGCADGYFEGMPITIAGSFLVFGLFFHKMLPPAFFFVLMIVLSFLMVSTIPIKKR